MLNRFGKYFANPKINNKILALSLAFRIELIMEKVKKIAVGVLGLIATLMIISVFIPSLVHIERSLIIDAPKEILFQQVNNLQYWQKWSAWPTYFEESKATDGSGNDLNLNSSQFTIKGLLNSDGKLTMKESIPFEIIQTTIDRQNLEPILSVFKFEETTYGMLVTWSMETEMGKSPYRKYKGLFLDRSIGPKIEESLNNLSKVVE